MIIQLRLLNNQFLFSIFLFLDGSKKKVEIVYG